MKRFRVSPKKQNSCGLNYEGGVSCLLLGLALVGNSVDRGLDRLLVGQVVVLHWLQVGVQLVDQGDAGRDVQLDDLVVRHLVQVLDQSSDRVSVSSDQNSFAILEGRAE